MKILVEKGLIEIRAGRGTFVTTDNGAGMRQSFGRLIKPDSPGGLASLLEVRELLEPEIAALAASRITDESRGLIIFNNKTLWETITGS